MKGLNEGVKRFHHNFTKSHYSDNRNNFVYSVPSIYGMLLTQLTSFVVISAIWLRLKRQLKNSYLTFKLKVMAIQITGNQ